MKQRIVQGLVQLADPVAHASGSVIKFMLPELVIITGYDASEIASRARNVLTRILHAYDDFSVRTIDSFVSRIIRTFAHDLHLPVDFEIELDRDMMLDEAVDKIISKAGIDDDLTRILVHFIEARTDDEKSWQIEADIKKTAEFLFSEGSQQHISKLHDIPPARINKIAAEIRAACKKFDDSIVLLAQQAKILIAGHGIDNASFYRGSSGIGGYFYKLADGNIEPPNSFVLATISGNKWIAGKADKVQESAINLVKDQLAAIYAAIEQKMDTGFARHLLLGMIEKNIFQLGLLWSIAQEISIISREKRILHISEFNKRITDIILKEPVPFIYERIGEKYFNYMVDEFQDTSELQWKNLLPLIGDSLAYGRYNLVVGDGKQAIYRFRNGNVEQFILLPDLPANYEKEVFGEAQNALNANYDAKILNSNFRSLPEIIHFNNDFFGFISRQLNEKYHSIYAGHSQQVLPGKTGGFVSVEFVPHRNRAEFDELNIGKVFDLVNELRRKGYAWSDVAILTRTNREGSIIARHLMSEGISVVSAEALLLAASPEVNFIVTVMQHISDPQNLVAIAGMLNELARRGLLNGSLIQHFPVTKRTWPSPGNILAVQGIEFNTQALSSMPLYDLCEEIIRIFLLHQGKYNVYIQFFLDFVNKISSRQGTHLADLLEAWDAQKERLSVVVPEGIDAIRIMTIHKAKGLEFPVVIWPMALEKLKTTFNQLWVDLAEDVVPGLPVALLQTGAGMETAGYSAQYQDERNSSLLDMINLVYVAFTRPAERLYILTREPSKGDANNLPNLLNQFIDVTHETWVQQGSVYTRGMDATVTPVEPKWQDDSQLSQFISSPWQQRIRIARRAPVYWSVDDPVKNQAWGTLIHDTLAAIKTINDVPGKVEALAAQHLLNLADTELLKQRVTAAVQHPLLSPYFTEDVVLKPEAGILTPGGDVYRPDRVIFVGDVTIVMEFKTGLPKPEHEKQLSHYAEILALMGYTSVRKLLVYLYDEVVVKEL